MFFIKSEKITLNTDVLYTLSIYINELHVNTHGGLVVIKFDDAGEANKIYEDLSAQLLSLNGIHE